MNHSVAVSVAVKTVGSGKQTKNSVQSESTDPEFRDEKGTKGMSDGCLKCNKREPVRGEIEERKL